MRGHDWQRSVSEKRLAELAQLSFYTWQDAKAMQICGRCGQETYLYGLNPPMSGLLRMSIAAVSLVAIIVILIVGR